MIENCSIMRSFVLAGCLAVMAGMHSVEAAQIITDFETDIVGLAPGVPVTSTTGNVTVEMASGFSDLDPWASLGKFAYLRTGPGATGAGSSGIDRTGAFGPEFDIAEMTLPFVTDRDYYVFWEFTVLTAEGDGGNPDPVDMKLDGWSVFDRAIRTPNGTFSAIPSSKWWTNHTITGPYGSVYPYYNHYTAIYPISSGAHTLEFFIGDASNELGDTALILDNFELRDRGVPTVPVPSALLLSSIGAGLVGWMRRRRAL